MIASWPCGTDRGLGELGDDAAAIVEKALADPREMHAAGAAVEQPRAEALFERGDRDEDAQVAEVVHRDISRGARVKCRS